MKDTEFLKHLTEIDSADEMPSYSLSKADIFFYFILAPLVLGYCSYHLVMARCLTKKGKKLQIKQRFLNFLLISIVYVKTSIEMFNAILLTRNMET